MKIENLITNLEEIKREFLSDFDDLIFRVKEIKKLETKLDKKQYIATLIAYRKALKLSRDKSQGDNKDIIKYINFLIQESQDKEFQMRLKKGTLKSPEYKNILNKLTKMDRSKSYDL